MKKIIVEARLLARNTGITGFFEPLLICLIKSKPDTKFYLVTKIGDNLQKYQIYPNVHIVEILVPRWLKRNYFTDIYYGLFSFPAFVKRQSADLLLSPYYDFMIPSGFSGKIVIGVLDLCYWDLPKAYKLHTLIPAKIFIKQALKKCTGVFTISETSKKKFETYFNEWVQKNPITIIYPSFSSINLKTELLPLPYEITSVPGRKLLYSGGFENRKNLSNMFSAFRLICNKFSDVHLVITGNLQNNAKFLNLLDSHYVHRRVILTGKLSNEQMNSLYQKGVNGAINLSLCEGFGMNSYEAILNGLPLLCSDIEINREVAGLYPVYCDPTNVEDIARGLSKLIEMSRRSPLSKVDDRFRFKTNEKRFLNFIQKCMR